MIARASCMILAVCAAGLAGCAPRVAERQQYVFQAARHLKPLEARTDATLEVRRLTIDAAFAARNLVYRLGEFEYETDYYREYLVAPAVLITEQTREWLTASGLFEQVLSPSSRIRPTHTLEGNLTAVYGDFREAGAPAAVLEIRYFLLKNGDPAEIVVFAESYRAREPVAAKNPEALVEALNRALADILSRLETDLQRALAARPTDSA